MKLGLFMMPSHPPERGIYEGHQWDLDYLALVDDLGYDEAWIGEHILVPWEPCPAPDLVIAQALLRTKRIKLGTGVHCLPYHHPAELAHRVAYLDHMSQGRLLFGVGAGAAFSDLVLFNIDGQSGQQREMSREALEIILKIWRDEGPFDYKGKYWHVTMPDTMYETLKFHLTPYQKPHPPLGIAAITPKSSSMMEAGKRGCIGMSLAFNIDYIKSQWEAYEEGSQSVGKTPHRSAWRIVRDVWVADTDEEARELALNGMTARVFREFLLGVFESNNALGAIKHDTEVADDEITEEYMADHQWLLGSPETVANKLRDLYNEVGGFGGILVLAYDQWERREEWEKSTRLLAQEVMPRVADLTCA